MCFGDGKCMKLCRNYARCLNKHESSKYYFCKTKCENQCELIQCPNFLHCQSSFPAYFYKEPKKFTGGELFFPEYDYILESKNNSCIIFPSYFLHEVLQVKITDCDYYSGFGRYCMSQFTNIIEKK